jgi:hypothetical protein
LPTPFVGETSTALLKDDNTCVPELRPAYISQIIDTCS